MKKYFLLIPVLLLAACVSSGVKVDPSKLAQFHKGETTYTEVVQKLGRPSQATVLPDGTKVITYTWVSAQARPESFIPIAGAFIGGADAENTVVSLTFDGDGILQTYTSTQGSTGTGTGFEAYSQPRNSDQPNIEQ
jgi:outer membrane protein assembly factor BamE (lipoprotein component of BamABCDE complex)